MTAYNMTCCVCGGDAGRWEQHWNRDTEYSICPGCAAEEMGRHTPEEMESLYGKPGVNYNRPMIVEAGRRFVCAAVFPNTKEGTKRANAFMERTPGTGVLCVSDAIYIANNDDNGVEVPHT